MKFSISYFKLLCSKLVIHFHPSLIFASTVETFSSGVASLVCKYKSNICRQDKASNSIWEGFNFARKDKTWVEVNDELTI